MNGEYYSFVTNIRSVCPMTYGAYVDLVCCMFVIYECFSELSGTTTCGALAILSPFLTLAVLLLMHTINWYKSWYKASNQGS